ncbi:type II toxin-antitoxin system VapC family toxin [Chitinimonas arctica]|uniref:Type II toxin-antitoxin system VapC family toxin n=1 Tax=Chitinimonas arctica TaxID=2594795 RepID=A0A516SB73_9NEIS|nr:type II toxin-antitoxin system VapC family toxin [Chitinimonas arctica]QDQ25396.1 type II toxin-antitoxin system VapC family toxin [Chitinimonas arctica]
MTTYLLDTNIASHIIKGDIPRVRERLVAVPIHCVAVSVVTQAELLYGVAKRGHPLGLTTKVHEFLAHVPVLPWTAKVAEVYGELRIACEAGGVTLAPMDMMIAAHAKTLALAASQALGQAILVTRDGAFSRARMLGGLTLEDWTKEVAS